MQSTHQATPRGCTGFAIPLESCLEPASLSGASQTALGENQAGGRHQAGLRQRQAPWAAGASPMGKGCSPGKGRAAEAAPAVPSAESGRAPAPLPSRSSRLHLQPHSPVIGVALRKPGHIWRGSDLSSGIASPEPGSVIPSSATTAGSGPSTSTAGWRASPVTAAGSLTGAAGSPPGTDGGRCRCQRSAGWVSHCRKEPRQG